MYQKPTSPLSIGGVLDDGIKLLKEAFTRLFVLSLITALVSLLPEFVDGSTEEPGSLAFILALASLPLQMILFGALVARTHAIANSESMSVIEALGVGFWRLLPMIICGILYAIAIIAGFVALIIPGLILILSLSFSVYLTITDRMGPLEALKVSHGLVWGRWWHTAAVAGVVMFIVLGTYVLLGVVAAGMAGAAGLGAGDAQAIEDNLSGIVAASFIGLTLLTAVINPVMYAFYIALLNDLKLRKEGDDLDDRIGALEEA